MTRRGRRPTARSLIPAGVSRWLTLFVLTRGIATTLAAVLLIVHRGTDHDLLLAAVAVAYATVSIFAAAFRPRLARAPTAWAFDGAVVLALVLEAAEWRSSFYLLGLTALVLPSTALGFRQALAWGSAYTLAYFGVALATGIDWSTLETTARLEAFSTHLMMPMLVTLALAYATQLLARLEAERERSERLALQSERRRIAWELHDSAKQRIHAAHLILGAFCERRDISERGGLDQAIHELRAATTDMETSLADLRAPLLEGRRLAAVLRERADQLAAACPAQINVHGEASTLPPFVAAHTYRIANEALANAVRHASCAHIDVRLEHKPERLSLRVTDDGRGISTNTRSGATGLQSMRERAHAIGGELVIAPAVPGPGTAVSLVVPLIATEGEHR
ncbi:MAG: ATP-binding protein [Actinomycetota bacterium]|nr:ATP-binding protein [Actinomycetota bacterium]